MRTVDGRHDELAEFDLTEDELDAMLAAGEQVDVAGPPGPDRRFRFEVHRDGPKRYGWRLATPDGEVLATGGVFATKAAAVRAAEAVMRASAHAALVDRTAG